MTDRLLRAACLATFVFSFTQHTLGEIHGPRKAPPLPENDTVERNGVEVFDFAGSLQRREQLPESRVIPVSLVETPLPGIIDVVPVEPAGQIAEVAAEVPDGIVNDAPGHFLPPPIPLCEEPQGMPVTGAAESLFAPLSNVRLGGMSTTPPETSDSNDHELLHPENDACAYMGASYPGCYATAPQLAAFGPYRNAYPFCHRPLYFEDPNLERCGRGWRCFTTVRSAGLFAGQLATLPLHMLIDCPHDRVRALPDCPTCHKFGADAYCPAFRN